MPPLFQGALSDTVDPGLEQTVPRSLVHKRSLDNVLLTDIRACGDERFTCAGRVPTAHRFFNDSGRTPQQDILFYTEVGRQASLAISHAFLDVDTEDVFIFDRSEAALTDAAWSPAFPSPLDWVVVDIAIRDMTRRRNNAVSRVVAEHTMFIGSEQVFHGVGAWTLQPAALFERIRRMSTTRSSPVPDSPVSDAAPYARRPRHGGENAVISLPEYIGDTDAFVASLIVDQSHPYFFDHPCDHVPGMLLLEGCAQLAMAAFAGTARVPRGTAGVCAYDVNFAHFVECGLPTTLTAQLNGAVSHGGNGQPPSVHVSIAQQNVVCGTTTMSVAFPIPV